MWKLLQNIISYVLGLQPRYAFQPTPNHLKMVQTTSKHILWLISAQKGRRKFLIGAFLGLKSAPEVWQLHTAPLKMLILKHYISKPKVKPLWVNMPFPPTQRVSKLSLLDFRRFKWHQRVMRFSGLGFRGFPESKCHDPRPHSEGSFARNFKLD